MRKFREDINPDDVIDKKKRSEIFRSMAMDFVATHKARAISDVSGNITRLMEKAYIAGVEAVRLDLLPPVVVVPKHPRFTLLNLSYDMRLRLPMIRDHVFGPNSQTYLDQMPATDNLFVFMQPPLSIPNAPSFFSKEGKWRFFKEGELAGIIETRNFNELLQSGLFEIVPNVFKPGGWEAAVLTERGYELLRTGETCAKADYRRGITATREEWRDFAPSPDELAEAAQEATVAGQIARKKSASRRF